MGERIFRDGMRNESTYARHVFRRQQCGYEAKAGDIKFFLLSSQLLPLFYLLPVMRIIAVSPL
jgi:hypothetical protein